MSHAGHAPLWKFCSTFSHDLWPAVPSPDGAFVLALLFQLEYSQWLPAERLRELQALQLDALLKHAFETVPYYRARWGTAPDAARIGELPLLTRRELQENFEHLKSRSPPPALGAPQESRTSGSTGAPVRLMKTMLDGLMWNACTLRDHRWHRRELARTLAVIRKRGSPGADLSSWGPATDGLVETGPCAMLGVDTPVDAQLEWLARREPGYLLTYPSLVRELTRESLARGLRLRGLLEVRTLGESLEPELRALCREAWGVPLTDVYTAEEVGYIALQCPQSEHYHVQAEFVLVEVLDEHGRACMPGETGRIVVTSLHNLATPLVRYEIGDFADVGEACVCGRGLPVLRRILGRVRNTLVTADGRRYWPTFGQRGFGEIAPVLQHQFVQKAYDLVEARLVTAAPLTPLQEERLRARIASRLPAGIRVTVTRVESLPRGPGGKFEDFVSEVAGR